MKPLTIVCRTSKLAVVQSERAKARILRHLPEANIRIVTKKSTGDKDRSTPLYELEGRDFFTKDIDEYLLAGEADFAVHSLKDVSIERAEDPTFASAILERDDPRDVALFRADVFDKLASGKTLILGTSSLRRMELVPRFLNKALPRATATHTNAHTALPEIRCEPIRGNVDSRLRQLRDGRFDGIILAAAGLNRLLAAPEHHEEISNLLHPLRFMLLPLVDCPPAPGQGALVIEALVNNHAACEVLEQLRNPHLEAQLHEERALLRRFGGGCHQRFGGVNLPLAGGNVLITQGIAKNGDDVGDMRFDVPEILSKNTSLRIFAASDFMADFFSTSYEALSTDFTIAEDAAFVSHHRAVQNEIVLEQLRHKRVWTAGTRSWFELAKRGVWVEGCSDGFGLRFLDDVFHSPLVKLNTDNVRILTNTRSAKEWNDDGFKATGLYALHENVSDGIIGALQGAEACFWTSFHQYQACRTWIPEGALHLCPSGKTAELFRQEGIEPILFPTIKAFLLWRTKTDTKHTK